jgi:hypothetical protein
MNIFDKIFLYLECSQKSTSSSNISPNRAVQNPLPPHQISKIIPTYSMEHSPSWEANWFAASQEIPHVLWNPKVHYRTHKRQPSALIMSLRANRSTKMFGSCLHEYIW